MNSENPFESPFNSEATDGPQHNSEATRARVKAPGIAMIISGALSVLCSLYAFFVAFMVFTQPDLMDAQMQQQGRAVDGGILQMIGIFYLALGVFILLSSLLAMIGGVRMLNCKSYGLALTGTIVSVVPCLQCSILSIPIGIWAMVVLMDTNVKKSFK